MPRLALALALLFAVGGVATIGLALAGEDELAARGAMASLSLGALALVLRGMGGGR